MCYMNCNYEDREGECKLRGNNYPSDARCVESICPQCDRVCDRPGHCKYCEE